jgi:hypothetical protein
MMTVMEELEPLNVVEIHDILRESGADVPVAVVSRWDDQTKAKALEWAVAAQFEIEEDLVVAAPTFIAAYVKRPA